MSRTRALIVVALIVLFVAVGGALIYANNRPGNQHVTFNLTVTGATKMTPDTLNAKQGDTITINVTSDEDGEVHLHVYDIPFEVKAGQTVSHTFTADKTGTCLIEWEDTSAPLGNLIVSP